MLPLRLSAPLVGGGGGKDFPRRWWVVRFAGGVLYTRPRCLGGGELVDVESGGAQMLNIRPMMRKKIKPRAMPIIWRIMTLARRRMRRVIFRMIVVLMLGELMRVLMVGGMGVGMGVESRWDEV